MESKVKQQYCTVDTYAIAEFNYCEAAMRSPVTPQTTGSFFSSYDSWETKWFLAQQWRALASAGFIPKVMKQQQMQVSFCDYEDQAHAWVPAYL
jgi:hypothetical protein